MDTRPVALGTAHWASSIAALSLLLTSCGGDVEAADSLTAEESAPASTEVEPAAEEETSTEAEEPELQEEQETEESSEADEAHCEASGTFTPDGDAYEDDVTTLESLGAIEFPAYTLTSAEDYSPWRASSRSAVGAKGPLVSYNLAFYDGELGWAVDILHFEEDPIGSEIEVRQFTEWVVFNTGPQSDNVFWRAKTDGVIDESLMDGSGGHISFVTGTGGGGGDYYYPVRVDLQIECPYEAIE